MWWFDYVFAVGQTIHLMKISFLKGVPPFSVGGDAGVVKRVGFRTQWLSACAGSNPVPRSFFIKKGNGNIDLKNFKKQEHILFSVKIKKVVQRKLKPHDVFGKVVDKSIAFLLLGGATFAFTYSLVSNPGITGGAVGVSPTSSWYIPFSALLLGFVIFLVTPGKASSHKKSILKRR